MTNARSVIWRWNRDAMRSRRSRHPAIGTVWMRNTGSTGHRAAMELAGDAPVVRLRDVELEELDDVQEQLDRALGEGPRVLVVDMSGVRETSSTTIAALLWIKRRCVVRGIEPVLRHPSRDNHALERSGLLTALLGEPTGSPDRARGRPAPRWLP